MNSHSRRRTRRRRISFARNGSAVWNYTYNKLGKPVTETLTLGTRVNTITHAYDTLANEASLTYPSGSNIAYLPNALGQASKADTYATGLTYRASGFLSGMTYGNGAIYSALPNLRGLPARRLDKKGTTVITDELIGYDQDANPVCVRDSTTGNPGHRDFSFDARNRLIKASAPNQAWLSSEYQYDSQDNIKLARLGTRQYNYTQNALNQLASITQPSTAPNAANYGLGSCADASLTADLGNGSTGPSVAIPNAGTAGTATTGGAQTAKYTFATDNEGRMIAKGTQAYVYDALNRMTQVTTKESYVYDGHGRRVQITKTADGSINYPLYSLDGKLILEDNRQTLKRSEYIYAGGRLVAKRIQPITATGANNGAATTTTIHTDFLGSPVAETNAAGTVTRVERYTPYGEPSDMQLDAGPGFTGHATDVATGLTYMQQRYMDQEIGRFISPDPVLPNPESGANFNRYWYADNNPVKNVDPDGRFVLQIGGTIGGGILGGLATVAHDVYTGKISSIGTYTGNIVGGATAGLVLTTTGSPTIAGAAGAAAGSALQQKIDTGSIDPGQVAVDTVVGATIGKLAPGVKIPGATAGKNSWGAVAKSVQTKLSNGTITNVSGKTVAKSVGAAAVEGSAGAAADSAAQIGKTNVSNTLDAASKERIITPIELPKK